MFKTPTNNPHNQVPFSVGRKTPSFPPQLSRPSLSGRAQSVRTLRGKYEPTEVSVTESPNLVNNNRVLPSKKTTLTEEDACGSIDRAPSPHFPKTQTKETSETIAIKSTTPKSTRTPTRLPRNTYRPSTAERFRNKFRNLPGSSEVSSPVHTPKPEESSSRETAVPSTRPIIVDCLPKGPMKPPRTFAHDVYVQEKEELKKLVGQKYRNNRMKL